MYRSNGTSSMATLMQTSNCMKNLANGGLAGDTVMGVNEQPLGVVDGPPMTRPLLPHEMASLPMSATAHSTQSQTLNNPYNNNFGYYNSIHHHHHSHTNHQHMLHPHQQHQSINASPAIASATAAAASHHLPHLQTSHHHLPHLAASHNNSNTDTSHTNTTNTSTTNMHDNSISSQTAASGHMACDLDRLAGGDNHHPDDKHHSPASNTEMDATAAAAAAEEQEPEPEIDIVINNVVCSFSVRCHLNLRDIALNGVNVEFRRENGMVTMKLRRPYTTASIWSSGRITCTGATSEDQAKVAARRYSRCLQKLGFNVRFNNFRVVNVLGTCSMPWAIKIVNFSEKYKKDASYEPELHPGVTYKLKWPKATLKIFSTGSITVTANSVNNVQAAIEHIFPLVYEFRKKRAPDDPKLLKANAQAAANAAAKAAAAEAAAMDDADLATTIGTHQNPLGHASNDSIMSMSDVDDDDDVDDLIEEDYNVDEEEIL